MGMFMSPFDHLCSVLGFVYNLTQSTSDWCVCFTHTPMFPNNSTCLNLFTSGYNKDKVVITLLK